MGLTIHYTLQSNVASPEKAKQLVEQLRQAALDLAMSEVSEVLEFSGTDWTSKPPTMNHLRWLLVQSRRMIAVGRELPFRRADPCLCLFHLARRGM